MTYRGETRPYGMGQDQYDAYVAAMQEAGVSKERIVQCIGQASASAGTHGKDGADSHGHDFSCATDIHINDLTETQIHTVLLALADKGFAGWWRHTGSFANNRHCHFVWSGYQMKRSLRNQIHDFLAHKNGLVGHDTDEFWASHLKEESAQKIRTMFLVHNVSASSETDELEETDGAECCGEPKD